MTVAVSTTTVAGLALEPPAGMARCTPADLEVAPGSMGLALVRLFRRGRGPCGLAGHPGLEGRASDGTWRPIDTVPSPRPATTWPAWTGAFTPALVAVVSIRPISTCDAPYPPARYGAARLVLPGGEGVVELPVAFEAGGCPLEVTPFGADSQDP